MYETEISSVWIAFELQNIVNKSINLHVGKQDNHIRSIISYSCLAIHNIRFHPKKILSNRKKHTTTVETSISL